MDTEEKVTNQIEETDQTEKKETIFENATKWYNRFFKMPLITFISIIVVFFIWSVVDICVWGRYGGVMRVSSDGLAWFIWNAIGLLVATITYCILKLKTSLAILQTEYLKKISEKE